VGRVPTRELNVPSRLDFSFFDLELVGLSAAALSGIPL
jgi:hypothetical protein